MLRGEQIQQLVDLLKQRNVILYHSCQFIDFCSYLTLGGIPSRKKLTENKMRFTKFETDADDHKNRVWDKIFLNLQDFGEIFEEGNGVPTVYGPIHLLVKPESLLEASDVSIALRSAGSPNFNRNDESLKSIEEVDRIFRYPSTTYVSKRKEIKWRAELIDEFKKEYVSNPEMSISIASGLLPMAYVTNIKIDSYFIKNDYLYNHLKLCTEISSWKGYPSQYLYRKYKDNQRVILNDVVKLLLIRQLSFDELLTEKGLAAYTKNWAKKLHANDITIQWQRYSNYLRQGTLIPILNELDKPKNETNNTGNSDWGMYKCSNCKKLVMGYEKEKHQNEKHTGSVIAWKKVR